MADHLVSQVTGGQLRSFEDRLSEAGMNGEMLKAVLQDPRRAGVMVEALRSDLSPVAEPTDTTNLVHRLFTGLGDQVTKIRQWNEEFGWGFSPDDLTKAEAWIGPHISIWPVDRLTVVTLVPYLPDWEDPETKKKVSGMERTFHALWTVAAREQKSNWRWDGYNEAGSKRLRLLKGINHKPGLRWEVINLGANRSQKPKDVRNAATSPHAGILASAALHPEWVRQMDGTNVPFVFAPGYEVNVPGLGPWRGVPDVWFDRGSRGLGLSYRWYESQCDDWAGPVFVRE